MKFGSARLRCASARHFSSSLCSDEKWGGRRDSNPQQQAPQAWTLPLSYDHQPDSRLILFSSRVKFASLPTSCAHFRISAFMSEYKGQFEVFEGPLDLLLYLIKKEEVDIYDVNLTKLATQFIAHIDLMREFDLEVAGEFLVMASTLMYIKSRELLPVDQQVVVEGEDEGEDPRWELIRKLVEYKKFKDAAAQLKVREIAQENIFPRLPGKIEFENAAAPA